MLLVRLLGHCHHLWLHAHETCASSQSFITSSDPQFVSDERGSSPLSSQDLVPCKELSKFLSSCRRRYTANIALHFQINSRSTVYYLDIDIRLAPVFRPGRCHRSQADVLSFKTHAARAVSTQYFDVSCSRNALAESSNQRW
jgi:hypothetical protein